MDKWLLNGLLLFVVSSGVCWYGKEKLHYVDQNVNIDAAYYSNHHLELTANRRYLLHGGYTFK